MDQINGGSSYRPAAIALQYFPEHVLFLASQLPPSFWHCSSAFFAAVTSPAKAGTVKASARVRANIEMRVFMTFSPLRWLLEPVRRMLFGDIRSDGHRSRGPPGHQASGNPGREGRGFLRMKLGSPDFRQYSLQWLGEPSDSARFTKRLDVSYCSPVAVIPRSVEPRGRPMELQPPQIEWWFHFIRFRRMALSSAPIASFQPLRQAIASPLEE